MTPRREGVHRLVTGFKDNEVLRLLPLLGAVASAGAYMGAESGVLDAWNEGPTQHVTYMHYGDPAHDEVYCIDRISPYQGGGAQFLTLSQINSKIRDAIKDQEPDWDNPDGTFRVFFHQASTFFPSGTNDCDQLAASERQEVVLEYHVNKNNAVSPCTNTDGINCAYQTAPITWEGHTDYRYGFVALDEDDLRFDSEHQQRQTINHETGHNLGFADPNSGNPPHGCTYNGELIRSVMHAAGYCPDNSDLELPTSGDIGVEVVIMNQK